MHLFLSLVACTSTPGDEKSEDSAAPVDTQVEDTAPAEPTLAVELTPDTVIAGAPVVLDVTVENFTFVDPTTKPAPKVADGEGHFHIDLDGVYYVAGWEPSVTLDTLDMSVGAHTLTITLEDSKHNPIEPTVSADATLTIQ